MSWQNRFKSFIKEPQNIILIVLFILMSFLTLLPLVSLIRDTLIAHPSELMSIKGAKAGDFTLFHWYKVFFDGKNSKNLFYSPFWNTVKQLCDRHRTGRHGSLAGGPLRYQV